MRHGPCSCVTPRAAGTRNGFACSPCRALRELERRAGVTSRVPVLRPVKLDDYTMSLLVDYECPMCGPFVDDEGETTLTQEEADLVICGDLETGERACPDCDEEVEQTMASLLETMTMLTERFPALGPAIAEKVADALGGEA